MAKNKVFGAVDIIDGEGSLDSIDGSLISFGDIGMVVDGDAIRFYKTFESTDPEDFPVLIIPNKNAGNKRWKLLNIRAASSVEDDDCVIKSDLP